MRWGWAALASQGRMSLTNLHPDAPKLLNPAHVVFHSIYIYIYINIYIINNNYNKSNHNSRIILIIIFVLIIIVLIIIIIMLIRMSLNLRCNFAIGFNIVIMK